MQQTWMRTWATRGLMPLLGSASQAARARVAQVGSAEQQAYLLHLLGPFCTVARAQCAAST